MDVIIQFMSKTSTDLRSHNHLMINLTDLLRKDFNDGMIKTRNRNKQQVVANQLIGKKLESFETRLAPLARLRDCF